MRSQEGPLIKKPAWDLVGLVLHCSGIVGVPADGCGRHRVAVTTAVIRVRDFLRVRLRHKFVVPSAGHDNAHVSAVEYAGASMVGCRFGC